MIFAVCLAFIALVALFLSKWISRPIEALKETQNQLIQSAKMASIGTLAAGVAHELNQSLMVIRGYTQMLLEDTSEMRYTEETLTELQSIEHQTTRMMKIIRQLRDFSRQSKGDYEELDLHQLLNSTLLLVERQLKNQQIEIQLNFSLTMPIVEADANQLEQVFLNLLINSCDAMESQDSPKILTINTRLFTPSESVHAYAVIEFQDTGLGMSKNLTTRIFDPFFTTKEVGKGTGLGLSISYGLIKEHGGWIEVDSQPGKGSVFRILLPVNPIA